MLVDAVEYPASLTVAVLLISGFLLLIVWSAMFKVKNVFCLT